MTALRTTEVVAKYTIPEGTLRWWRSTGQGPKSYKLGRTVFYDLEDVDAWVQAQKAATARGGDQRVTTTYVIRLRDTARCHRPSS